MNIKEINETLFAQARERRMCRDMYRAWYGEVWDADRLADAMYRNMDFCIDNRWPSKETLREMFSDEQRHRNGIVTGERWSLLNATFALALGDSRVTARYNAFNVGKIYAFGTSRCEVSVKGHASVTVHAYDSAAVNVTAEEGTHVLVVTHSRGVSCSGTGQMTIKECF